MISGIHHMSFTISDMERSVAFYHGILGMQVAWDSSQSRARLEGEGADAMSGVPGTTVRIVFLAHEGGRLELIQYMPPGKALDDIRPTTIGSGHICFQVSDIRAFYSMLQENGIQVQSEPQQNGDVWVMYFRDPDGIILEAVEGGGGL